jgi:hypothetical protein
MSLKVFLCQVSILFVKFSNESFCFGILSNWVTHSKRPSMRHSENQLDHVVMCPRYCLWSENLLHIGNTEQTLK